MKNKKRREERGKKVGKPGRLVRLAGGPSSTAGPSITRGSPRCRKRARRTLPGMRIRSATAEQRRTSGGMAKKGCGRERVGRGGGQWPVRVIGWSPRTCHGRLPSALPLVRPASPRWGCLASPLFIFSTSSPLAFFRFFFAG